MDQDTLFRAKPGKIMLAGAAFLLLVAIPYPFAHLRQDRRAANRGESTVKVERKNFGQVIRLNGTTQASRSFVVLAPRLEGAQVGSMVITKLVPAGTHWTACLDPAGPGDLLGGYAGCFQDPDGHPWEVAWNPGLPVPE